MYYATASKLSVVSRLLGLTNCFGIRHYWLIGAGIYQPLGFANGMLYQLSVFSSVSFLFTPDFLSFLFPFLFSSPVGWESDLLYEDDHERSFMDLQVALLGYRIILIRDDLRRASLP